MKRKIPVIISLIAVFAAGFAAGHFQDSSWWRHRYKQDFNARDAADAYIDARALTFLRDDNQDKALKLLEASLDLSLYNLQGFKTNELAGYMLRDINTARDYRGAYPSPPVAP